MLRKVRKVIPRDACITLYNAMILPLFDYCSAVWDGCGKTNRDYLDKLQTRAASIIEGRKVEQCEIHDILELANSGFPKKVPNLPPGLQMCKWPGACLPLQ